MALSEQAAWRSPQLGTRRILATAAGPLPVYERGAGRPLVFAHGWLGNANLWRGVAAALAADYRTVVLDLPLGAHPAGMNPDADLSPAGVAGLISETLTQLHLREAVVVGNDSGGAYSQIALAADQSRVAGLAISASETPGGHWPPAVFDGLVAAARVPGALRAAMGALRDPAVRMAEAAFGRVAMNPIPVEVSNTYILPIVEDDGVLADAEKAFPAASIAAVEAAAAQLVAEFAKPVRLIWPADDHVFPHDLAQAYARSFAQGGFETLPGCRSFTPEDQPTALAARIDAFVRTL